MAFTITLPWPPSVNHYWRFARGRWYVSGEGQVYRGNVHAILWEARAPKIAGRLAVRIVAAPPDKRARDIDNILKALLDALEHAGLYANDSQIDLLEICRAAPCERGQVTVTVSTFRSRKDGPQTTKRAAGQLRPAAEVT